MKLTPSLVPTPEEQELIVLIKVRGHWRRDWDVNRVLVTWRHEGLNYIKGQWERYLRSCDRS